MPPEPDPTSTPVRRTLALSPAMEDYVRAIYVRGGDEVAVMTTALARDLDVAPASVTGMVKRLHAMGLVRHERYAGVQLTDIGRKVALEILRHHRLIETFLAESLGIGWDAVHDEAHRLEHHISDALGERMADFLGHPDRDPHGAPIPPRNGEFVAPRHARLADSIPGARLIVREVPDEDAADLRALALLGIRPDAVLDVVAVAPDDGPVTVRVGGVDGDVARAVAQRVAVDAVVDGDEAPARMSDPRRVCDG
ncbi:MAG: metal-dependent transcriptional regulator [Ardenticatenales bacterium]|jgi:DtxR family Mn-dependent transcriptional regulator|nr:metal-dependent transcriptional regulator [Ardenticatenales bacterium]